MPPQGWRSIVPAPVPILTSRTRPCPAGGFTFIVFTISGRAASSSSGDPLRADRQTGGHVLVQPRLERGHVLRRVRHVEVETALVLADRPAGHAVGQHDRQEVQRAVHPHQPVAALPVEDEAAPSSPAPGSAAPGSARCSTRPRSPSGWTAPVTASAPMRAGVAGLAAGARVEDRCGRARCPPAPTPSPGLRLGEVGIVAEEILGHRRLQDFGALPSIPRRPVNIEGNIGAGMRPSRRVMGSATRLRVDLVRRRASYREPDSGDAPR